MLSSTLGDKPFQSSRLSKVDFSSEWNADQHCSTVEMIYQNPIWITGGRLVAIFFTGNWLGAWMLTKLPHNNTVQPELAGSEQF